MGPTWGPSRADRTQVGPMLAPWTLFSGSIANTLELHLSCTNPLICHWPNHECGTISATLNSQSTLHNLPSQLSYGVPILSSWEKRQCTTKRFSLNLNVIAITPILLTSPAWYHQTPAGDLLQVVDCGVTNLPWPGAGVPVELKVIWEPSIAFNSNEGWNS